MPIRLPKLQRPIYYAMRLPLLIVGVAASLIALKYPIFAKAVIVGSGCWFIAMLLMTWRLFGHTAWQGRLFIKKFFWLELGKFLFIVSLFMLMIQLLSVPVLGMCVGYCMTQMLFTINFAVTEVQCFGSNS